MDKLTLTMPTEALRIEDLSPDEIMAAFASAVLGQEVVTNENGPTAFIFNVETGEITRTEILGQETAQEDAIGPLPSIESVRRRRKMGRAGTIIGGAALAAGSVLAACEPTGVARCDTELVAQRAFAKAKYGARITCKPHGDLEPESAAVLGWADHKNKIVNIWAAQIKDNRVLKVVASHELGHLEFEKQKREGTKAQREDFAWKYAWCMTPLDGVSYGNLNYTTKPKVGGKECLIILG